MSTNPVAAAERSFERRAGGVGAAQAHHRRGGLASVATEVGVLVVYGLALVALASWRFRLAITR